MTPLHHAAAVGNAELVHLLLVNGAKLNVVNNDVGHTAPGLCTCAAQ